VDVGRIENNFILAIVTKDELTLTSEKIDRCRHDGSININTLRSLEEANYHRTNILAFVLLATTLLM